MTEMTNLEIGTKMYCPVNFFCWELDLTLSSEGPLLGKKVQEVSVPSTIKERTGRYGIETLVFIGRKQEELALNLVIYQFKTCCRPSPIVGVSQNVELLHTPPV
jgi:hypothetical protein